MNKFPKLVSKKWNRYSKLEKVFIVYLWILLVLEFFLPILNIEGVKFSFINSRFIEIDFILLFTLVFVMLRNVSYTVKWLVKSLFGFYENEALVNFWVLFLHISLLVLIKDMVSLLAFSQSSDFYKLSWWYYILGIFLIFGLIWNLFLAINNSLGLNKKKNYSKVIWVNLDTPEEKKEIKTLFEN